MMVSVSQAVPNKSLNPTAWTWPVVGRVLQLGGGAGCGFRRYTRRRVSSVVGRLDFQNQVAFESQKEDFGVSKETPETALTKDGI